MDFNWGADNTPVEIDELTFAAGFIPICGASSATTYLCTF